MKEPRHHILITDRNSNVRNYLRREFIANGYDVSTAQDAEEVLAALKLTPPPVLLLMDMQLSGVEQPGFWESLLAAPGPPFVVAHAFSDDTLPEELSGHAARVNKSGDTDALLKAVSWCLSRRGRMAPLQG